MARVAPAPPEGRVRLIATLGLASLIAGLFSLTGELSKERHDSYIQACATAAQIVSDDALDGDLDPAARKAVVALAERRLRRCWE